MNILLFSSFRLAGTGGVATIMRSLHNSLKDKGHKVSSLLLGDSDRITPIKRDNWSDTYGIKLRDYFVPSAPLKGFIAFLVYFPMSIYRIFRFASENKIDVVHVNFVSSSIIYIALLRPILHWKIIVTFHGSDIMKLPEKSKTFKKFVKYGLSKSDSIVTVSEQLLVEFRKQIPELSSKSLCIPTGNPLNEVVSSEKKILIDGKTVEEYVLAVGSLVSLKGYPILLEAIHISKNKGISFKLLIIGGGPEREKLEQLSRNFGIEELVFFLGEIPHNQMQDYYSNCKFFVHASYREGMGLVIVEAMSYRKAVIATNVGGIPEIISNGSNGILINPGDPETLSEAMIQLEKNGNLRRQLSESGYEYVIRERTWNKCVEKYLSIYNLN